MVEKLPLPPSIDKKETDTIPVLVPCCLYFALQLTKLMTRSLRYRFTYLPKDVQHQIIGFYKKNNTLYENYDDNAVFERELGSIVMQIVSVVINKGHRGELWTTAPNTLSRNIESRKDKTTRLNDYIRSLDFNVLKCDDFEIIRKILMKALVSFVLYQQEVLDITEVHFADYFSYNQNMSMYN